MPFTGSISVTITSAPNPFARMLKLGLLAISTIVVIWRSPLAWLLVRKINIFFLEGPQKDVGACLVIVLSLLLAALMSYYLWVTVRASAETKESLL